MTIQGAAKEAFSAFETATRPNGEKYLKIRDGAPEWVTELIRAGAHEGAGILPDDYRYRFAHDALELIADSDDPEDAALEWEPDMYTGALVAWLGHGRGGLGYCDGVLEEFGGDIGNTFTLLQMGQAKEFDEVFRGVLGWLTEYVEEHEEETEEEPA